MRRASKMGTRLCSRFDLRTEQGALGVKKSRRGHGGRRKGAGAKKDPERAAEGRRINLSLQGQPLYSAEQIVQHLIDGNREAALGIIRNMIKKEHREEAKRLAEKCAALLAPYPDLWLRPHQEGPLDVTVRTPIDERLLDVARRGPELLRRIAAFMNGQMISTVVNHAFAGQPLKPRGDVIEKDDLRLAAVATTRKKAEEERAYWTPLFELLEKQREGELTPEDVEWLRAITPEDLWSDG
jgi:hypothetical protein